MTRISAQQLQHLVASDRQWALMDIREAGEADAGHIHGATFLPRRMLELRLAELVPDRGTTIVVYDEGGPRADLAVHAIERAGYRDARVLDGGTAGWQAAGFALATGSNVPSKLFGEQVFEHEGVPQLPVTELERWRREGTPHLVVDIRTPDEYRVARIPGAWGGFGVDVGLNAADLAARNVPVVVHCAGRTRSIIACQTLRALGVTNVAALENGTMGWTLAGFELEREPSNRLLVPSSTSEHDAAVRADALATAAGATRVDVEQLRTWLSAREAGELNLYVFDVRQVADFDAGHMPGARTLPGGLAIQRTDEFVAVRNARIVLVDEHEARALITAYWMRAMGFPHVHVLAAGLAGWRDGGGAIERGRRRAVALRLDEVSRVGRRLAPAALHEALRDRPDAVIVDVGTSRQYADGHVPRAAWLPYGWLEQRVGGLASSTDTVVVVTDQTGLHAGYAAENLVALGYRNVWVLDGGVAAWSRSGLPVEKGLDDPAPMDIVVPPYAKDRETMAKYLAWEQQLTRQRHGAARRRRCASSMPRASTWRRTCARAIR
jgi:rhodanese-related sulfurtransferase